MAFGGNLLALRREQTSEQLHGGSLAGAVAHGSLHRETARAEVGAFIQRGRKNVVADIDLRRGNQIDITIDSAHVEHVLSFQIGTVRPTEDLHADVVLALANEGGEVKLGILGGSLGVAHLVTVHIDQRAAVDSVKVHEDARAAPIGGQREGAAIGTHRVVESVLHDDVRRVVVEGILHIDI